ncbi:MAG: serine/threonine protein kinase [Eggerthellaceae bacterium]|nr:serine/threonine protein kinase [Eggerthellaceae bacterium]
MTPEIVGAVFKSVAHALQVAHENQVLHLDIKPDNVLINRQGEVKVTDFGLSKLSNAEGYERAAGGTIGYMPPEQMNLEAPDARCDEWALAALTYEMIAQKNPFFAQDLEGAKAAIYDAELVLPSLCMEGLSTEADDVIFYALNPEREERYASVADFAEELQPLLGNPKTGKRQLARLVGEASNDMAEPEAVPESVSALDRTDPRNMRIIMRLWSVINCAVLGAVGLSCLSPLIGTVQGLPYWGCLAAIVVVAAIIPHLGALLAVSTFALALITQGAYLAGAVLLVAGGLWWWFSARRGFENTCAPLSIVPLGLFGLGAVVPILCGYFLRVKDALIGTVFACILALALAGSAATTLGNWSILSLWTTSDLATLNHLGFGSIRSIVTTPGLWIDFVSWVLAAITMAGLCSPSNRAVGFLGALLAGGIIILGAFIQVWLSSGGTQMMPEAINFARALVPLVVGGVFTIYGVPIRSEDD